MKSGRSEWIRELRPKKLNKYLRFNKTSLKRAFEIVFIYEIYQSIMMLNVEAQTNTLDSAVIGIGTFLVISHSVLLRMRNVSDNGWRENQMTHFVFNNFFPEILDVYEIVWENMVDPDRPHMTTQHGACALHAK